MLHAIKKRTNKQTPKPKQTKSNNVFLSVGEAAPKPEYKARNLLHWGWSQVLSFYFKLCFMYSFWMGMIVSDGRVFSQSNITGGRKWISLLPSPCRYKDLRAFHSLQAEDWEIAILQDESPYSSGLYLEGTKYSLSAPQHIPGWVYSCSAAIFKHFWAAKQRRKDTAYSSTQGGGSPAATLAPTGIPAHDSGHMLWPSTPLILSIGIFLQK